MLKFMLLPLVMNHAIRAATELLSCNFDFKVLVNITCRAKYKRSCQPYFKIINIYKSRGELVLEKKDH